MDNPMPVNSVFSEIVKEVFGEVLQYETDVPEGFNRPCFLFINPDKSTKTEELTKTLYRETKLYEIYMFCVEGDVYGLTDNKEKLIDYLMGVKKVPIPGTDKYYTLEDIAADTNDVESVVAFMIKVSQVKSRNLRRPQSEKINKVINKIILNGEDVAENEQ